MNVHSFLTKYMRSYTYIIEEADHVILIDPCEMDQVKEHIAGKTVDFAFLTHEHYDHISGVDWVRSLDAPIVASESCNRNLGDSKLNHSRYYSAFCAVQDRLEGDVIPEVKSYKTYADWCFDRDYHVSWCGHELLMKITPGHSTGGACLLIDGKTLFAGDTIFRDVPSNPDLMCGDPAALEKSVAWIMSLPDDTFVYPGHYETFFIKEKR